MKLQKVLMRGLLMRVVMVVGRGVRPDQYSTGSRANITNNVEFQITYKNGGEERSQASHTCSENGSGSW